jgi:hypothetical protein
MSERRDITDKIERLPSLEEVVGIELCSLFAVYFRPYSGCRRIDINGEILVASGLHPISNFDLFVSFHDDLGRVMRTANTAFYKDDIMAIRPFAFRWDQDLPYVVPSKIRLYPQKR